MKTLRIVLATSAAIILLSPMAVKAVDDPEVFDSTDNYIGACSYTATSTWTLTQDLTVSKFQLWYKWQSGETTLPVTVTKDGQDFASFTAVRGDCDPYQATWCNADFAINKAFPAGTYATTIPTAYQCLKPGSTGTVRLYGTASSAAVSPDSNANTNTGLIAPSPAANGNVNAASDTNAAATNTTNNTNTSSDESCDSSNTIWYVVTGVLVVIIFGLAAILFSGRKNKAAGV